MYQNMNVVFLPYSHELLSREHCHLQLWSKCPFWSLPFSD